MKYAVCLICVTVIAISSSVRAADEAPAGAKRGKGKMLKAQADRAFQLPKSISLSPEQQAKIDELKTEHQPKLMEAIKKVNAVLTPEQRAARMKAAREAREQKLSKKEIEEAMSNAVSLTEEEKSKLADAEKELNKLKKEIGDHVKSVLTDEQRAQLRQERKANAA